MAAILSRRRSGIFSFGSQSGNDNTLREIAVKKDEKGYGFQVSGECPAHVVKVRHGSTAQKNGLEPNDIVVKIDSENVTNKPHDDIVSLIRQRESFNMVVQKRQTSYKHPKMPSHPIISSQSDDIARIGGYDVTCNMITSEYQRLTEFKEKLLDETVDEQEKQKLKSLISTSQQIIQNLQKKVPTEYLEKMRNDLNIPVDADFCTHGDRDDDVAGFDERDGGDAVTFRPKVQRRSSVNERIARTHSVAQDVLASFRSLRKQQNPKLSQYHCVSLQNLALTRDRQDTLQENRILNRKNTISDSNLSVPEQNHSAIRVDNPLIVDTTTNIPLPSSSPLTEKSSLKAFPDTSNLEMIKSLNSTANFLKLLIEKLCSCNDEEKSDLFLETVKEVFYFHFLSYLQMCASKDKKDEDANRNYMTLLDLFSDGRSAFCLKFCIQQTNSRSPADTMKDFAYLCRTSLHTHMQQAVELFPSWRTEMTKADIESDFNGLIGCIEASKNAFLKDEVKKQLGDCCVTFLKINKKKYKKEAPFNKKTPYVNLFSKKKHPLNSNRTIRESRALHRFQSFPLGHVTNEGSKNCESCSRTLAGQPVSQCVACKVLVHPSCASALQDQCGATLGLPLTPLSQKHSPMSDQGDGLLPTSPKGLFAGSEDTDSVDSMMAMSESGAAPNSESDGVNSRPSGGVKRAESMKEGNADVTRTRKASYIAKISPRNASDPYPQGTEIPTKPNQDASDWSSGSQLTSDMSSNHSYQSLKDIIDELDTKTREAFNVVLFARSDFMASDSFATVDQITAKDVYKKLNKEEKQQQNLLLEFLNSEKKQTYNLKLITTVFESAFKPGNHNFTPVEDLMRFHFEFYLKLLQCVNKDLLIKDAGKVFVEVFDSPDYCTKFGDYYRWTTSHNVRSDKIRHLEMEKRQVLEKRTLQDLMASEVQRATKYKLLMEGVLKYSSHCKKQEKEQLNLALKAVTKLIADVDSAKGLQDFRVLLSRLDQSDLEKGDSVATVTTIHGTSQLINFKTINLMEEEPLDYTCSYALIKFHRTQSEPRMQAPVVPQLKIFKNYLVVLLKDYLILIERDPISEKLTWKRYLDQDKVVCSVIPLGSIIHATIDFSRPLKDDQAELVNNQMFNFTCVCQSMQLIVFLSSQDDTNKKWKKRWNEILPPLKKLGSIIKKANSTKEPEQDNHHTVKSSFSEPGYTNNADSFNFQSQAVFTSEATVDEDEREETSKAEAASSNSAQQLAEIAKLRDQVMELLKQSFDLARLVYDPNNTLRREQLGQAFECVVNEQLLSLVDKDQWLRSLDAPLVRLDGQLDAKDARDIHQVQFFVSGNADEAKTLHSEVVENEGVAVAEVKGGYKIFSDASDEANEVHLQKPSVEELNKHENRLQQKMAILNRKLTDAEGGDDECNFDAVCDTESSTRELGDDSGESGKRAENYRVDLETNEAANRESSTDDTVENESPGVDVTSLSNSSGPHTEFAIINASETETGASLEVLDSPLKIHNQNCDGSNGDDLEDTIEEEDPEFHRIKRESSDVASTKEDQASEFDEVHAAET